MMIHVDFSQLKNAFETMKGTLLAFTVIWMVIISVAVYFKIMVQVYDFWINIGINVFLIALALAAQRVITIKLK